MLEPVLDALGYVHGQGFVHGHIKPANIMGVEDQLKISSDGLHQMGESRVAVVKPSVYDAPEMAGGIISPAADVWSLGMTLVEALTQHLPFWERSEQTDPDLPHTLPTPFLELASHCLRRDPQRRWRVAEIAASVQHSLPGLNGGTPSSRQAVFAKRRYVVPLVAFGVVIVAMLVGPRLFNGRRDAGRAPTAVIEHPHVQSEPAPKAVTAQVGKAEARPPKPKVALVPGKVVHQVMPDVPRKARDTIRGKVRVSVRVRVNPSGNVAGAKLDSPGPSRYFAQLSLKAARRWKFRPAEVDGEVFRVNGFCDSSSTRLELPLFRYRSSIATRRRRPTALGDNDQRKSLSFRPSLRCAGDGALRVPF